MPELLAVLQQALQLEHDGERYYEAAAEQANNPIATHTFATLAQQERQHAVYFQTYYDYILKENRWPPAHTVDLEAYSASELVRDIFQKAHTELDADAPVGNELHELYEGAMEFERKSVAL